MDIPIFATEDEARAYRARKLRELMEAKWNRPGVACSHRRCKWLMPMKLGGTHGYANDICDDNISEPRR